MMRTLGIVLGLGVFLTAGIVHAAADPAATCTQKKAKAAGKKTSDVLKAIGKNLKKPNDLKLGADVSKASSKFTKSFTKEEAKGGCATTDDSDAIEAKVDAFADLIARSVSAGECGNNQVEGSEQCDGADDDACPGLCEGDCDCGPGCGNGVVEGSEQCDPPGEQAQCASGEVCTGFCECETIAACNCGSPDPERLIFTETAGSGICGTTENATGSTVLDLDCGGLYIGGGAGDLPLPVTLQDEAVHTHNVAFCNGTSLTLRRTTEAETGDRRTCTAASAQKCDGGTNDGGFCLNDIYCPGTCTDDSTECLRDADCPSSETCSNPLPGKCDVCYFGKGGQPVINQAVIFLSTCLTNVSTVNSSGAFDCSTGEALINYHLDSNVFLTGVDASDEPGWQSCPVCVGGTLGVADSGICEGGPNDGLACEPGNTKIDLHDCCDGGGQHGKLCDDNSDCPGGGTCISNCSAFPTSQDCPPPIINNLGAIPVPFELLTGTSTQTASDGTDGRTAGTFCGFCRDVAIEGSNCFDGNPDPGGFAGCPDSTAQPNCEPASGTTTGCGDGVPCTSDSDCSAPYETCEQKDPGAFRNQSVRYMESLGSPAASPIETGGAAAAATLADSFCIDSSYSSSVDASSNLPGPGAVILVGEYKLE